MTKLVVDTSVAIKWLTREPLTEQARAILAEPTPLIAPDWLLVEAASAFWKKIKKSELLEVHASRHLEDLPAFFETLHSAAELVSPALLLAYQRRHSVYDCIFIALALREDAALVTADEGLARVADRDQLKGRVQLLA